MAKYLIFYKELLLRVCSWSREFSYEWNVCGSKWKVYPRNWKGITGRDRMLLQNSGTKLGVEWSGNWQIAYQHESPDHSISVWDIVARRSSKIEGVRDQGGSKCAKHGWFSRVQRNRIVQTISFLYVYWCLDL